MESQRGIPQNWINWPRLLKVSCFVGFLGLLASSSCWFEGCEVVLTQVMEEGAADESSVRDLLKAEYKLLCKGDAIKEQFDK